MSTAGTARFLFEPFLDAFRMKPMLARLEYFHGITAVAVQRFDADRARLTLDFRPLHAKLHQIEDVLDTRFVLTVGEGEEFLVRLLPKGAQNTPLTLATEGVALLVVFVSFIQRFHTASAETVANN